MVTFFPKIASGMDAIGLHAIIPGSLSDSSTRMIEDPTSVLEPMMTCRTYSQKYYITNNILQLT